MDRSAARLTWLVPLAVFSMLFSVTMYFFRLPTGSAQQAYVLGDDDEEEDEEDDDDDDEDDDDGSSSRGTVTVWETRYETRQVTKTVLVTPEEYRSDVDGDRLVDALDPDPKVPQWEYFTDDDGDAVPNALDRHRGEDDFTYVENGADADDDGIVDTYGSSPVR